jgi:excisionase family DNA binding protein
MEGTRILYPLLETADMLGVARTSIYTLVNGGHLTMVKVGRRSLITAESIARYVESLTSAAGSAAEGRDDA